MLSRRGLLTAGRRFRCTRALLFDGGGGSDSKFQTEAGKRLTQTFSRNEKEPAEEKNASLMVNGHNEAIYSAVWSEGCLNEIKYNVDYPIFSGSLAEASRRISK
jgi:hypothetical protein